MITILLVVLVLLLCYILKHTVKPPNYPPGPFFIPIIGNIFQVRNLSRSLGGQHFAFSHLAKTFKTNVLGLKYGNDLMIVVQSYPLVKQALTDEAFDGRPDNFFMRLRTMGTRKGITGTDGEPWIIQRNFVVKHLKKLGLGKDTGSKHIKDEVAHLIKLLPNSKHQLKKLITPSFINVFWKITCGSRLMENDPRIEKLIELLNIRSKAFDMGGGILNVFPWVRFIAPKKCGYDLIVNMNQQLDALFMETIQEHYKTWTEEKCDDLIDIFINEIKNGSPTFTDEQLVMVLLDLFIAGSQATSNALDFAFMMMILRPDIQEKVQNYLDDAFGRDEDIDYSKRDRVPYIEGVILEVFRYFLIIPIAGPRRALRTTELGGYTIPKDTTVLLGLYSFYKDSSYWQDPETFRPERFISEDGKLILDDHLMPFGVGRRRCLGEVVARKGLFVFFSEIIRKYKITLKAGSETPSMIPEPGIILSAKPYLAEFTERY